MSDMLVERSNCSVDESEQLAHKVVRELPQIATLPEVSMQIVKLANDPSAEASDLKRVIDTDPVLGVRILKVVNSAFYGLPQQIASIEQAVVLLGFNAIKNISVAASLTRLFRGGKICTSFDARELWVHSMAVAVAARSLAKLTKLIKPDEAFLAGLIHDIGIVVEIQSCPTQFAKVVEKLNEDPQAVMCQVEQSLIGATHPQFGLALCQLWGFPAALGSVTRYHHCPRELPSSDEHQPLVDLVHIADVMAARSQVGFTRTVETTEIDRAILDRLGIDVKQLVEIEETLAESVDQSNCVLTPSA